jgi:hypothetical protein
MNAVAPKPRAEFLFTTGKIARHYRERSAIIYVRQSTLQQVERHQESTRLQYGLVERALQLGWAREQIVSPRKGGPVSYEGASYSFFGIGRRAPMQSLVVSRLSCPLS